MYYDTNLSKYLMIFTISPEMDVIFVNFSQEIVSKFDKLTIMGTEFNPSGRKYTFVMHCIQCMLFS